MSPHTAARNNNPRRKAYIVADFSKKVAAHAFGGLSVDRTTLNGAAQRFVRRKTENPQLNEQIERPPFLRPFSVRKPVGVFYDFLMGVRTVGGFQGTII